MTWKTFKLPPPKHPLGERRVYRWFAWYPVACSDEKTRWLEFVNRHQISWGMHFFNWGTFKHSPLEDKSDEKP